MKLLEIFEKIALSENIDPEDLEGTFETFAAEKLLKSETLQKAFEIKSSDMEELYNEAYMAYESDQFERGAFLFRWLALFNPFAKKYWMGLAACRHMHGQCEKALLGYAMAAFLDREDPYPHFHAYECYMAMSDGKEAKIALEDARVRAAKNPVYSQLRQEIVHLQGEKIYA